MITRTTYEEMSVKDFLDDIKAQKIKLPKYQRDVVWSLQKKRDLIDSVRKNFPIGAILLAEVEEKDEGGTIRTVHRVIDGLQRTSSFISFHENPRNFVHKDWIDPIWVDICNEIFEIMSFPQPNVDEINQALFDFLLCKTLDRLSLFSCLASVSKADVNNFNQNEEIQESVSSLIKLINDSLDVSSRKIPLIKFVGSAEDQATAFEKLNTGSVQLTKYEIAAALWNQPVSLEHKAVHSEIKQYWKARIDSANLEIDGIGEDGTPEVSTLFDVLVGVGRYLARTHPLLVKESKSDSIAFQIAAICVQLRLANINSIEERLPRSSKTGHLDLTDFVRAILEAARIVDDALNPVLGLKLTAKTIKSQFSDHSELQIASLIAHLAIEARDADEKWTNKIRPRSQNELAAILSWYLIDRVRSEWGNAGDSKLFNRVWKTIDHVPGKSELKYEPNNHYRTSPDTETARIALNSWFESEMEREHKERSMISSESKMILRYFYSPRIPFADHASKEFQLDHLIPIDWWKRLYQEYQGDGSPINSIGNLCLMEINDHKTKTTLLPYQWFENRPGIQKKILKDYFLVSASEMNCVSEITGGKISKRTFTTWRDAFDGMSRSRWAVIRESILDRYFN